MVPAEVAARAIEQAMQAMDQGARAQADLADRELARLREKLRRLRDGGRPVDQLRGRERLSELGSRLRRHLPF